MRPRLSYKELRFLNRIDYPKWAVIAFVTLVIFGGLFEASHNDPWFGIVGLLVIGTIFITIQRRQLQRRIAEYEALKEKQAAAQTQADPPPSAVDT